LHAPNLDQNHQKMEQSIRRSVMHRISTQQSVMVSVGNSACQQWKFFFGKHSGQCYCLKNASCYQTHCIKNYFIFLEKNSTSLQHSPTAAAKNFCS